MDTEYIKVTEMTPALHDIVEMVFDGWWADEPRIDWTTFVDKVESYGFDLGDTMDSPISKDIKKLVRQLRRAGQ